MIDDSLMKIVITKTGNPQQWCIGEVKPRFMASSGGVTVASHSAKSQERHANWILQWIVDNG